MSVEQEGKVSRAIDHELTTVVNSGGKGQAGRVTMAWDGRVLTMVRYREGYRIRVRRKGLRADVYVPVSDLAMARKMARVKLDEAKAGAQAKQQVKGTLEEVAAVYVTLPLKCSAGCAKRNVGRLKAVVRQTWGEELQEVPLAKVPELWPAFVAAKQGRKVPDYNTRALENRGINSAMRQARSVFLPRLRPFYRTHGIVLPEDAAVVTWLPQPGLHRPEADDAGMLRAWGELQTVDVDLWAVIGLARFAGLRLAEILALRGKWVQRTADGGARVLVCDRPEDGWWCKTGRVYAPLVWHPQVAEFLLALEAEQPAIARRDAARWAGREPQRWLRQWLPDARLPLHRLRGLYAQQVMRETEEAVLARRAGLKAASEALGHTSTATTEAHYVE